MGGRQAQQQQGRQAGLWAGGATRQLMLNVLRANGQSELAPLPTAGWRTECRPLPPSPLPPSCSPASSWRRTRCCWAAWPWQVRWRVAAPSAQVPGFGSRQDFPLGPALGMCPAASEKLTLSCCTVVLLSPRPSAALPPQASQAPACWSTCGAGRRRWPTWGSSSLAHPSPLPPGEHPPKTRQSNLELFGPRCMLPPWCYMCCCCCQLARFPAGCDVVRRRLAICAVWAFCVLRSSTSNLAACWLAALRTCCRWAIGTWALSGHWARPVLLCR